MQIRNENIKNLPEYDIDRNGLTAPVIWYGTRTLAGASEPWASANIGSIYINQTTAATYTKIADANADADWKQVVSDATGGSTTYVQTTGNQSVGGVKTFTSQPVLPVAGIKFDQTTADVTLAAANPAAARAYTMPDAGADASFVMTAGAQTIAGVKTFSSAPVFSAGATFVAAPVTTLNNGAVVAGKCTAVENGEGILHQTTLTLTLTGDNDLDLADGDHGTGVKIYDFPAGRIFLLGAVINGEVVTNDAFEANPNDVFYLSAGSVVGADDADLSDTEQNIIPKSTIDTTGNTVLTNDWHNALQGASFDGTTDALDLYINAAVAGASLTKALTIAITGTLTLTWINLGDY